MRHRSQNQYAAEAFEVSLGTHVPMAGKFLKVCNISSTFSNNPAISPARGDKWTWTMFEFLSVDASMFRYLSGEFAADINPEQVS